MRMKNKFLAVLVVGVVAAVPIGFVACKRHGPLKAIQTQKSQDLEIALLSETGELKQGKNEFVIEFKSASTRQPVDAGRVRISSTMAMPGMAPMSGAIGLSPARETGRYGAEATFEMSGEWEFTIRWDGPQGSGITTFRANVR